ncbi:MAG: bifunctional D-glycero-beta-D-manno-heptose-7-phosphate kinase/D-glycero-beta-D-manno-heptose 1-phosphate adenylyltransferase HldE [Methylotetracoccus sp.]|nr:bifunctional D-glycero-beta-D-manno-heptose-7-phosphate kinase/D-glycero-beta-D-manno-heptose 1-phosphate adenylyltransferase HldE [Methylotetracoccus sp.]
MKFPDFRCARLLVAGDVMLDRYWFGGTSRISPEAPVPIVRVDDREERTGGAGNVAVNIARLGAHVTLLGYCGQDEAGDSLIALLERAGVRCRLERLHRQPTITKLRVISRHQQLLRLDFEELLKPERPRALLETFEAELIRADVVVLSDYGKGTLGRVQQLIAVARGAGKPVMVDPKGMDFSRYRHATAMTPNLAEFEAVAGPCRTELELREKAEAMVTELALHALLITRGEHGMTLFESGKEPVHLAAHAQEVFDVTGAGDTVLSTLSGAVAAGLGYTEATILANLAAGLVVGKLGTAAVSAEELHAALASRRAEHHGVVSLDTLSGLVTFARQRGERIVLTNGCFDILHPGHIKYLRQARALGDRLIVLVNSDDSVKRLKGQGRPINALEHRMDMLAALECVDWVAPFHDDTPRAAICRLLPDVLVKGGDYPDVTAIAGHDCVLKHGGEIKILNFVEGFSTTRLIADIRGEQER